MNLIDALCVIASSYHARSPEEEQMYHKARDLVEAHADTVMLSAREEQHRTDQLLFGAQHTLTPTRLSYTHGELQ